MNKLPKNALALLREMARPYKWRLVLFFGLSFFGILCWAASPFVIRGLINELTKSDRVTTAAWVLTFMFVGLRLMDEWLWRIAEYSMIKTKPPMIERMRTLLFDFVLQKPYNFFVNASSGQLGHWINQTTATLNDTVDNTIWGVWPQTVGLLLSSVFLFAANKPLAAIYVVWLVCLLAYNIRRGRKFGELVEKESQSRSTASGMVVDALSNHLSVRVFNSRNHEIRLLETQQKDILHKWHKSWHYHFITNMVKGNSVVVTSLVAMLVILSLYGKHSITVGDVALFIAYFNSAANSIWELSWQLDMYYRSFGTIDNALKGLSKGENEDTVAEDELDLPNKAIAFNNVGFYYPDQADKKVLHNINLNVAEGERVGLVGHSGAGKTTLVGLLLGFYRPTSGDFSIGGLPVERLGAHRLRDITAFVPQDTNLFNRTIAQNIGYAKPGATREEIMRAAKDAQANDFIQNLPKGYDTIIGERGVKLSGGQRQRIAIARALLKDSPILVLDEATSALDSVSEQAIQKAFVNAMKNRTALVVAHRLSTLRHLDRIIVFDGGTIVEQGTHDELVAKQGLYADLWRRQKDGFIGD